MITQALREVSLFAELDEAELARVAAVASLEERPAGTHLFSCGVASDAFYVLLEGGVRIRIPASAVQEERVVDLEPGSFFGEMGVMRGKVRMADADVTEDARLVVVDGADFDELLAGETLLAAKIMHAFMERLEAARSSEEAAREAVRDPHTLLFVAAGGGEGASFLCANLAPKVRDLTGESVLLIDLHQPPSLPAFLGVEGPLDGLTRALGSSMCAEELRAAAHPVEEGVHLLASSEPPGPGLLTEEAVKRLLPIAAEAFGYVLVDDRAEGGPVSDAVARLCDTTQVVLVAAEPSLQRARILHEALGRHGLDGRVRFVLNKYQEGVGVEPSSLEFDLGEEFSGRIDAAPQAADQARAAGTPVTRHAPRSPTSVQVTRLARQLLSLPAGTMEKLRELSIWNLFR